MAAGVDQELALFLEEHNLKKYFNSIVESDIHTVSQLKTLAKNKHKLKKMKMTEGERKKLVREVDAYLQKARNSTMMMNVFADSSNRHNKVQDVNRENLGQVVDLFATKKITKFQSIILPNQYKTITVSSKSDILTDLEKQIKKKEFNHIYYSVTSVILYYLRCGFSFDDILKYWCLVQSTGLPRTNDTIFHSIFQQSDPLVRALCIDDYSLNFPVPFYYPSLSSITNKDDIAVFEICHELWFSFPECLAIASFGVGKAGWSPVGKSKLLDKLFNTDFMNNNNNQSPFHLNSIDVQISKNIQFEPHVAIFDCNRGVKSEIIHTLSKYVNILLIHVLQEDMDSKKFKDEITFFNRLCKNVIIFVRDSKEQIHSKSYNDFPTKMFIPNLSQIQPHSYNVLLKLLFRECLMYSKLKYQTVNQNFIENMMRDLKEGDLEEILDSKGRINKITGIIEKLVKPGEDGRCLSFYPIFENYMSSYHQASRITKQEELVKLNRECNDLFDQLRNCRTSQVISTFLELFDSKYSPLLLRGLSDFLKKKKINYYFSIDILWREALLSYKYDQTRTDSEQKAFTSKLQHCLYKQIMNGEPFELIDGDNLVFHSKDIDKLLQEFYENQKEMIDKYNEGTDIKLSAAPIVISILGAQNSGKSTLLNYLFGCRLLAHAGRCTKGVHGTLFQMQECINNSKTLLILDTEGLNAPQRQSSMKGEQVNFDRNLVLFCLAVSQVVIVNLLGDISTELINLLKVCAYSINRLKINKVTQPKILFVLNQQTDPDVNNYASSMNSLMESLQCPAYSSFSEALKVSDLMNIAHGDLTILPPAFNLVSFHSPFTSNAHEKLIKFEITERFVTECDKLKKGIFETVKNIPKTENPAFVNFTEWVEMAGLIWETCFKCHDIVLYSRVEEIEFFENLRDIYLKLIEDEIYQKQPVLLILLDDIFREIKQIERPFKLEFLFAEKMQKFDRTYDTFSDNCRDEFEVLARKIPNFDQFIEVYEQSKSNLDTLIYNNRKGYGDKIKFHTKFILVERRLAKNIKDFKERIEYRIDKCIILSVSKKTEEFTQVWESCFNFDLEDEANVKERYFETLYANFKMESNYIDSLNLILETFRKHNFDMDKIVNALENEILLGLTNFNKEFPENWYFCTISQSYGGFTKVQPHHTRGSCAYLTADSLTHSNDEVNLSTCRTERKLNKWISKELQPIVNSLSGDYNSHEIVWGKVPEKIQILTLVSQLKNPKKSAISCWDTLMNEVKIHAEFNLQKDPELSQSTIKLLVNNLKVSTRVVNQEIRYIRAMLSHRGERAFTTLLFSYAFRVFWRFQEEQTSSSKHYFETKKNEFEEYFLQKIDTLKMLKGTLDFECMRANDIKISKMFALIYVESIKRLILNKIHSKVEERFEIEKDTITVERLLTKAEEITNEKLEEDPGEEITDTNHFVIQYICNRNDCLQKLFHELFGQLEKRFDKDMHDEAKEMFKDFISPLKEQFLCLQQHFNNLPEGMKNPECLISNYNFATRNSSSESVQSKEAPFRAMSLFLSKYLNPEVSKEDFSKFFEADFDIEGFKGIRVGRSDEHILPQEKLGKPLTNENFKILENTDIFFEESIFNIYIFIENFVQVLEDEADNFSLDSGFTHQLFKHLRSRYLKDALGCDMRCPSCGKFCEKRIHNDGSKCQIFRGHQLSSMGGKVWKNDTEKSAVLFLCDDYQDNMRVHIPDRSTHWRHFKYSCGVNWNWDIPNYEISKTHHKFRMQKIWGKFGRGILNYHSKQGTHITYIPYSLFEVKSLSSNYCICFLIDGTGSMGEDIKRARISVSKLVMEYQKRAIECTFRVDGHGIYHCDKDIIVTCPNDSGFSTDPNIITEFQDILLLMKEKLGELCKNFKMCEKEQVDEAVLSSIFVDYH